MNNNINFMKFFIFFLLIAVIKSRICYFKTFSAWNRCRGIVKSVQRYFYKAQILDRNIVDRAVTRIEEIRIFIGFS